MATVQTIAPTDLTLGDLIRGLGDVPLHRIRAEPRPGTATVQNLIELREREGLLCELVAGVLLEKAVGYTESRLAVFLAGLLNVFIIPRNLGIVTGPDGGFELVSDLVRIPDVAFIRWDRLPDRRGPSVPVPQLAPNLAVEVLSRGNTRGEMAAKRRDYFAAGVDVVWEIDPLARSVIVYTSSTDCTTLGPADTLDGGSLLPGFTLPLQDLFAELDRQG